MRDIKEKIEEFKNKYSLNFDEYEILISNSKKENFEKWDDYIEWKAYEHTLKELK
ncbi:MAG: hypothetical protein NTW25_07275 [Candidatus Kapabacteria bacterium]|nr:hypothetical protein [Candidatus Kapabacteria bacterium]